MPDQTKQDIDQKQHADENDDPAQDFLEDVGDERRGVNQVVEQTEAHANHKDKKQLVNNVAAVFASHNHSRKNGAHAANLAQAARIGNGVFPHHQAADALIPQPNASFEIRGVTVSAPPLNAPLLSVREVAQ